MTHIARTLQPSDKRSSHVILPGPSALDKTIRAHKVELPVIFATADCPEELLDQQTTLHVDSGLLKPYTLQELKAAMNQVLALDQQPQKEFTSSRRW